MVFFNDSERDAHSERDINDEPVINTSPAYSETETPVLPRAANYRITTDHIGEGGAKARFRYNIAAIRTLKQIDEENRSATPSEQEILAQYVGWGGLPQAFDERNQDWRREYEQLKEILSDAEYDAARSSTLNAHYTSPEVIKAIYSTLENMGIRGGDVLEPAVGTGRFFGLLPESMAGSRLFGVELDSITGKIAKLLYPDAHIEIKGYEDTVFKDNSFDIAIGNVPFGSYKVADREYNHLGFNIHDYFIAKTLDKVKPGGMIAFITTKGTLDKKSPEVRRYLAQRAELLGAIRLPNNAFMQSANTGVTTDILFLRKLDEGRIQEKEPDWVYLGYTNDKIPVNKFFADNPHMMLGSMAYTRHFRQAV